MERAKRLYLSILMLLTMTVLAFSQSTYPTQNESNLLSPQNLKKFQNDELPPEQKSTKTLKSMYQGVNFIDVRSIDMTYVANSGFSGDKNNFESLSGYNIGATWELPILAKKLGGDTPIIKARLGKVEIKGSVDEDANSKVSENSTKFIDTLGVSEIYTAGLGAGYCYHVGYNCIYGMYNSYLTGQLSTVEDDGTVSTVPTQLRGYSVGMTSTFEMFMGTEITLGLEYSQLVHSTPVSEDQKINTISVVFSLGLVDEPRWVNMRKIDYKSQ